VVDELIPQVMKLADVQRILQRLLAEGVSIRALSTILEALGDEAGRVVGDLQLTERIRLRLARSICAQYRDERERLHVVTLEPALEERILAQTQLVSGDAVVRLSSQEIENLCRTIDASLTPLRQMSRPEVLLVKPEIRAALRRLVAPWLPLLVVLSYPEITPETKVVSLGIVGDTKTG
jgi:flagellar biosynthesis protein FlhA